MRRLFCSLFLLFCIAGCSKDESNTSRGSEASSIDSTPKPTPYISTLDIDAIQTHGTIRLLAPRFDGADALPRGGISVLSYQELAESFAKARSLNVEWVFVDNFNQLIPSLIEGKGDLVVTNMSVTKDRTEKVSFSRPIAQIDELLVTRDNQNVQSNELSSVEISIPEGTAYVETLANIEGNPQITVLPGSTSDSDILSQIESGETQATVLDSDMARDLLPIFSGLKLGPTLKKNRPIAWAMRKDNPRLLNSLNEFLVSHHLKATLKRKEPRSWQQIKASGRLRMLTVNNPASYFMWRGELMGFDYELLKNFAERHNLHLSVVIKNSIPELFEALREGEGDLVAASITKSEKRENAGLVFSRPYLKVKEQVVGRAEEPKISNFVEMAGKSIAVNPHTVFFPKVKSLLEGIDDVSLKPMNDVTTEILISRLAEGEFDYTVADSHLVAIEKAYHQNVDAQFDLEGESSIAWALRKDQNELIAELNQYIKKEYRGLFYNVVFNKYFKNSRKIKRYQAGRITSDGGLSPFDDVVKREAKKYKMDWRLLVSQMYQESKFNPKAKSFAGAQGLMQVMPRTAKEMGYANLYVPENGIAAGVAYMNWLEKRFPGELEFDQRIYFTLAAYNAGTGHVRDARRLAKQQGWNPNVWFGSVEKAMLLLAKPEYYKKSRFGYVRGSEPVSYVRKIRDRYIGYLETK